MPEIILILHNIRSTHNVGSIFRTAEGFGVTKIVLSGYTPYPMIKQDPRLPHIARKLDQQISKTALGAEKLVAFEYSNDIVVTLADLERQKIRLCALEQAKDSINIRNYKAPKKLALILGEEVSGISQNLIDICEDIIEIPMKGQKESFNVSVAAGIALFCLTS